MKEYRLTAWPQMKAPFDRIAHRRMLSDLSHRFLTLPQLAAASGLRRQDVRLFLDALNARALLIEREATASSSVLATLQALGDRFRRAFSPTSGER